MTSTEAGMQMTESDEQKRNAEHSTFESAEWNPKVTNESCLHSKKQLLEITLTEEGIQIDEREQA
jgi:hypothetical protein